MTLEEKYNDANNACWLALGFIILMFVILLTILADNNELTKQVKELKETQGTTTNIALRITDCK